MNLYKIIIMIDGKNKTEDYSGADMITIIKKIMIVYPDCEIKKIELISKNYKRADL